MTDVGGGLSLQHTPPGRGRQLGQGSTPSTAAGDVWYREILGEPMRSVPAFREPGPRLELMDEQGIQRSLMFPTLASLLEERMRDDPD